MTLTIFTPDATDMNYHWEQFYWKCLSDRKLWHVFVVKSITFNYTSCSHALYIFFNLKRIVHVVHLNTWHLWLVKQKKVWKIRTWLIIHRPLHITGTLVRMSCMLYVHVLSKYIYIYAIRLCNILIYYNFLY